MFATVLIILCGAAFQALAMILAATAGSYLSDGKHASVLPAFFTGVVFMVLGTVLVIVGIL